MGDKRPTVNSIGMDLPIIADLGNGWFLAAHPNGACIANENILSVLWRFSNSDDDEDDDVPRDVRCKAIEQFERFAWPLLKAEFYPDEKEVDRLQRHLAVSVDLLAACQAGLACAQRVAYSHGCRQSTDPLCIQLSAAVAKAKQSIKNGGIEL